MALRIFWPLYTATVIILVLLIVALDCLQGTIPTRMFGILQCNYGLTSSDFSIRAGATVALLLFLGLVFGPIIAASRRRGPSSTQKNSV